MIRSVQIVFFLYVSLISCLKFPPFRLRYDRQHQLASLKPIHLEKLETLSKYLEEYKLNLSNPSKVDGQDESSISEMREKISQLETIFKLSTAFKNVEKDILLCEMQMKNNDSSIHEKAKLFLDQFSQIKDEIEQNIVELLDNGVFDV